MSIDLSIAEATQGWITHKELEWLAKQAQKHERIVEIGSYLGRSTRALGDNTKGVVYAIDDFQGPRDAYVPDAIKHNVLEIFLYNTGTLIQEGKIIPVVADHADATVGITPDMVFIDGSHLYEDVKRDILKWKEVMDSKGLICGHDYTNMYDVREAVHEIFPNFKIAKGTSIWYVQK